MIGVKTSIFDYMYEKYMETTRLMSKMNYIPAIASGEIALLLILYSGGMGLAIYNLPLEGPLLIMHLYGAILVAVLSLGLLAAAVNYRDKGQYSFLSSMFFQYSSPPSRGHSTLAV